MALRLTHKQALRFVDKLTFDQGCWIWNGARTHDGYGQVTIATFRKMAHVAAYEAVHGFIPSRLTLDHTCRNRACVNPAHLAPMTIRDNILIGDGLGARNARKRTCPLGHPYETRRDGSRFCRTCYRKYDREWKRARRQEKR